VEDREFQTKQNKAIRGYIIRSLVKGNQNTLLVRQLTNALINDGLIVSPDISKHLDYLQDKEYITFVDKHITAYNVYRNDGAVKLTSKGVDLVEGTKEDPGVDI
jgi:CTP:phosphocholine cytidylyltransferase-like protein